MKQFSLIVGIFLGSLFLQYCSDGTTVTLSSLGLTGTFRFTDAENGSIQHCRAFNPSTSYDNISQKQTIVISDTAITITNTMYDNYSSITGTFCNETNRLFTVSQTFNVVSVGSASTAIAIDNNSLTADDNLRSHYDNYTTRIVTGTAGSTTVTCYDEDGNTASRKGCEILKRQNFCGMSDNSWDNNTAYTVNGSGGCYVADNQSDGTITYTDQVTRRAGILLDNDTLQVPVSGSTQYLTLGYYDNSSSTRHISFREFLGPNILKGASDTTDYGPQSHSSYYFQSSTALDNITAFWGGSDNLSNLLVPAS